MSIIVSTVQKRHVSLKDPWFPKNLEDSELFETVLAQLYQFIHGNEQPNDLLPIMKVATLDLIKHAIPVPSHTQQERYYYLLGRALLREKRLDEALQAFERCNDLLEKDNEVCRVRLLRYRALATQQKQQFQRASIFYQELLRIWESLMYKKQTWCMKEDAQAFLCHSYLQLALCLSLCGDVDTAHELLDQKALPLLNDHPIIWAALGISTSDPSKRRWRRLHLFVPWQLSFVIGWKCRLYRDPALDDDLLHSRVRLLKAVTMSQAMPEGKEWTAKLWTAAAEMELQRCWLRLTTLGHAAACREARQHLDNAQKAQANPDVLTQLILTLPRLELRFCEMRVKGELIRDALWVGELLADVDALRKKASDLHTPDAQGVAARCVWLMGTIEAERVGFEAQAEARAFRHFQRAIGLIPPESDESTLIKRGISNDISRLHLWR